MLGTMPCRDYRSEVPTKCRLFDRVRLEHIHTPSLRMYLDRIPRTVCPTNDQFAYSQLVYTTHLIFTGLHLVIAARHFRGNNDR